MNKTLIQFAKQSRMSLNYEHAPHAQLTRQQAAFARAIIEECAYIADSQSRGISAVGALIMELSHYDLD